MRKFMSKRMLIDAAHPEQTRVAVVDGNRVEEFDFESQSKKQLRGNIYLAKITRVEASLQAAFVDYGGNRHGFLAFNEIHPDYYQIPVKDREELLRLEEEQEQAAEVAETAQPQNTATGDGDDEQPEDDDVISEDDIDEDPDVAEEAAIAAEAAERRRRRRVRELRRYKIQEVIKPGQVLLVQVSKEERGNKGAALTSYLSLAGRYCVLMPNTARGGGISRKISNAADRKRLKAVTEGLDLPKGVGLIIRTAGSKRTKVEIKRDYEYLGRLWSIIREKTLSSMAPARVHAEGGLVRRAVRDLYDKDIEAIYVEGTSAYHEAHDFMKMLMPSHAARVKEYKGPFPIFLKHQVEEQLEAIYDPNVRLKSGGYLVIHQTEALVAIDVNSGRSTKERNIEATALKTNLEAADEACRQMRLRDLAGLLVIDFIDMDENKNVRAVEKRMKDALKRDRARVQMGRISSFGLMEISRQRRRASVIEGSSQVCPTCAGIGVVRSVESAALSALQALEGEAMKGQMAKARLTIPTKVALYLLNEKRDFIASMERDLEMRLLIDADPDLHPPHYQIETLERHKGRSKASRAHKHEQDLNAADEAEQARKGGGRHKAEPSEIDAPEDAENTSGVNTHAEGSAEETPKKRRRGRRGGRGRRRNNTNHETSQTELNTSEETANTRESSTESQESKPDRISSEESAPAEKPKRRRRKSTKAESGASADPSSASEATAEIVQTDEEPQSKRPVRRRRNAKSAETSPEPASVDVVEDKSEPVLLKDEKPKRPARRRRKPKSVVENAEPTQTPVVEDNTAESQATDSKPKRPIRRRRPAKSAQASTETTPAPTQDDSAAPEAKATEKPKRRVRSRKPKADAPVQVPEQTAQKENVPAAKPAPKRRAVRTREPAVNTEKSASKNDGESQSPDSRDDSAEANKKSWWSRRFKA